MKIQKFQLDHLLLELELDELQITGSAIKNLAASPEGQEGNHTSESVKNLVLFNEIVCYPLAFLLPIALLKCMTHTFSQGIALQRITFSIGVPLAMHDSVIEIESFFGTFSRKYPICQMLLDSIIPIPSIQQPLAFCACEGVQRIQLKEELVQAGEHCIQLFPVGVCAAPVIAAANRASVEHEFDRHFYDLTMQVLDARLRFLKTFEQHFERETLHIYNLTETGISGFCYGIANEFGIGSEVNVPDILIDPETKVLCEHFRLEIANVDGIGSYILIADEMETEALLESFYQANVPAARIGVFSGAHSKCHVCHEKAREKMKISAFGAVNAHILHINSI